MSSYWSEFVKQLGLIQQFPSCRADDHRAVSCNLTVMAAHMPQFHPPVISAPDVYDSIRVEITTSR